jgi:xylan 1,4-beta-xylosidase
MLPAPDFLAPIRNPVLPGFHPDPSIVRVGSDFYVATSTFEWFPGVRLHHSRDLRHFRPLGYALDRAAQLDLRGNPRSGGVWAPCLSHSNGRFYLVYTDVKSWGHGFVDCRNYLVTSESIRGPWSDPIFLNGSGFDPSLFHDRDGKKWLVNMIWDHRPGNNAFPGIALQEFSEREGALVGEPKLIFRGTALGCTEGPHLYRHGDHYYLIVAEGGTSYDHAVTVARSRAIDGPYEADPQTPLLTARYDPALLLQKAGHASLVDTPDGEWFIAHLCGRPVGPERRCILGRETALQRVEWTEDGWLRLASTTRAPASVVAGPSLALAPSPRRSERDTFDDGVLGPDYQTLRDAFDESWASLAARPGHLRLVGRESLQSLHRQSMVARRLESHFSRFETVVEFEPTSFQELAGLVALYDDENFYYACVSHDESAGRVVRLMTSNQGKLAFASSAFPVTARRVYLRGEFAETVLRFWYSEDARSWHPLGGAQDATTLSDEHTTLGLGFTGAFVGMCAQDLTGRGCVADFDYFEYAEYAAVDSVARGRTAACSPVSANACAPSGARYGNDTSTLEENDDALPA